MTDTDYCFFEYQFLILQDKQKLFPNNKKMPLIIVVRSLKNSKLKAFGLFRFMEVKSHCVKDIRKCR